MCEDVCKKLGKLPAHPKRIEVNFRIERLGEAICTPEKSSDESQETFRSCRTEPEGEGFSSPNSLTHFSLLFLTESFWNSVAESWGSRGTGT